MESDYPYEGVAKDCRLNDKTPIVTRTDPVVQVVEWSNNKFDELMTALRLGPVGA